MAKAVLTISSKNYGAWALRGWLMARLAGLPFTEKVISPDDPEMKAEMLLLSASMRVPALDHDGVHVWDTLAIGEYLNEVCPDAGLLPADRAARAHCRAICGEMHSGFSALRSHCPMNIEAQLPDIGALVWRDQAAVRHDVARLSELWTDALSQHGGPMLFGEFSVADAYFAPVCMRLHTYRLPLSEPVAAYVERVRALPGVQAWIQDALAENDFLDFEEPYRVQR